MVGLLAVRRSYRNKLISCKSNLDLCTDYDIGSSTGGDSNPWPSTMLGGQTVPSTLTQFGAD